MAKGSGKNGSGKSVAEPGKRPAPKKKSKAGAQIMAWVMLGAIVFGFGGWGVTQFGGSVTSIGSVGGEEISTQDYSRAMQQSLDAYRQQLGPKLTAQQAMSFGLDNQVRQQLVTAAALDAADRRIGISVGDAALRQQIDGMQGFQGPDGKFSVQTYKLALNQAGYTETEFEAKMRQQMARDLLQQAVAGTVPAPAAYVKTVSAYVGETRSFGLLKLTAKDLKAPVPAPDEAALKAYYDKHKTDFTAPEAKVVTYAALTPEQAAAQIKIDDTKLQQLYDQNKARYIQPEKRTVDRLVYPNEADARAAKAALDSGKQSFDQLVTARGLTGADVSLGPVAHDDLDKAAGDAVFALTKPGVVGPVQSSLGPALFRMTAITPAKTTTFDEAKAELAQALKTNQARQKISGEVESINDKLAGGATLAELAKETDMKIGHIDYTSGDKDGMAAYPAFREAVEKAKEGDYPQLIQLKDGGIAALRLDKVRKAAVIPYDKVKDKVRNAWTADATAQALKAQAEDMVKQARAGTPLSSFGTVDQNGPMTRQGFVEGAPDTLVPAVFEIKAAGDDRVLQDGETTYIIHLDAIAPPKTDDPDVKKTVAQLKQRAAQGFEEDSFELFANALLAKTPVKLDQGAISAVNAQLH